MLLIKTSFVLKYVNRGQLLISWMFFRCHWSWLWVKRQLYRSHTFNEMIPFSQKIKYLNKTNKYFHSTNSASFLVCVISIIHFPSLRVCVIHPTIATISIHQFPFGLSLCGIFLFDSFFVIFLSFLFLLSCHSSGNHHRTFLYQSNTLPLISLSALMLCPLAVIIAACAITMRLHAYYAAIQQMYINLYVNAYATICVCLRVHQTSHRESKPHAYTFSGMWFRGKIDDHRKIITRWGYMCHESYLVKSRQKQTELL